MPPVAEAADDRPHPRPRLRNVSSSSTLLGRYADEDHEQEEGGSATPLAAPPPPAGSSTARAAADSSAATAIGYPFPPVGDLTVPTGSSAQTSPAGQSVSLATATAAGIPAPIDLVSANGYGGSGLQSGEAGPPPPPWRVKPLDYAALSTREAVQDELEATLGELGRWLSVVSEGLGRVVGGEVDVGVDLGGSGRQERGGEETGGGLIEGAAPLAALQVGA